MAGLFLTSRDGTALMAVMMRVLGYLSARSASATISQQAWVEWAGRVAQTLLPGISGPAASALAMADWHMAHGYMLTSVTPSTVCASLMQLAGESVDVR